MSYCVKRRLIGLLILTASLNAEEVGGRWGTEKREREYYRVVSVPIPNGEVIEGGAFELMPDNRLAVGTRRGDIFFMSGVDEDKPRPQFHKFAEGLDEIFGLAHRRVFSMSRIVPSSRELQIPLVMVKLTGLKPFPMLGVTGTTMSMLLDLSLMRKATSSWRWVFPIPTIRARSFAGGQ